MLVETDDEALFNLYKNKATRNEGFKSILTQYSQPIYYFLRKMGLDHDDADELLQDLFVKFSGSTVFNNTIRITLYWLASKSCLAYLVKHKPAYLEALTSEQRLIMVLKLQEEFDFIEIAQIIAIPVTEVRNIFNAGVSQIKLQIT